MNRLGQILPTAPVHQYRAKALLRPIALRFNPRALASSCNTFSRAPYPSLQSGSMLRLMPTPKTTPPKTPSEQSPRRRNKGFDATHAAIIDATVSLIADRGAEALSMAAVSRVVGINRTTLYYHFADREALLVAAKAWSSQELGKGFAPEVPQKERIDHISRFVLEHEELIKLWFDDFVSPGDIRERYPQWDALVESTGITFDDPQNAQIDPEVYCTIMLAAAFIAPRVYHMSVRPDLPIDTVIEKFRKEHQRALRNNMQYRED